MIKLNSLFTLLQTTLWYNVQLQKVEFILGYAQFKS
jgi:hypothetical protein